MENAGRLVSFLFKSNFSFIKHGRSLVAVDHLFTLIASAAAKFNLQQLNHLIEFIHQVKFSIQINFVRIFLVLENRNNSYSRKTD